MTKHEAWIPARFYPITASLAELAALSALGFSWIQWRDKSSNKASLQVALSTHRQHRCTKMQKLLLNDDAQAAQQLGFDGVHLGQDDLQLQSGFLPASPAADFIWGISVHNPQEADVALSYHPTYIALGPLFPSTNKPALPCQGVEPLSNLLNQLRHRFGGPIVAIGGIQSQNYQHAFNLGFDGVAFIHWNEQIIASASTPQQLAQKIENAVIQNN